jgi:hypothetical protein
MNLRAFLLPCLALGGAALLLGPTEEAHGFSKIGGSLNLGQRDFRVRNNFTDAASNNNTVAQANWPGWTGSFLAIWKGAMEWGSGPHGSGAGDVTQPNIGDGGANFDPAWMGEAVAVGSSNNNIVSAIASGGFCGGGVLAYTEAPIVDGYRIRFCDSFAWSDGPATIGFSQFDIQGVACHEYGHALGLGHSTFGQATMAPGIGQGSTVWRSLHSDDIAGVQCIYGVKDPFKPEITATQGLGTTVNIFGSFFSPVDNEVWFTRANVSAVQADPRVIATGVSSSGGMISLPIPTGAGPGDVLVKIPGGNTGAQLSNGFPWAPDVTIGNVPTACFVNVALPAEFASDPLLADVGGDPGLGPKIADATEVFDLSLDCSGMTTAGVYTIVLRTSQLGSPLSTSFGDLWHSGSVLVKSPGAHTQNVVSFGTVVLPSDPAFVGVEYTAQGFCSQSGGGSRLSSGLVQTVGG